jgi:heme oxygenase
MSEHPELDKLAAVKDETQAAGEFIEWLGTQGIFLAKVYRYDRNGEYTEDLSKAHGEQTLPVHETLLTLLARWKDIDQAKVDREQRAMLDKLRAAMG